MTAFCEYSRPERLEHCTVTSLSAFNTTCCVTRSITAVYGLKPSAEPITGPLSASNHSLPDGRLKVGTDLPLLARRYRYLSLLGEGRSAQVILAEDTAALVSRLVVIKILKRQFNAAGHKEVNALRFLHSEGAAFSAGLVELYSAFSYLGHTCLVLERLQNSLLDYIVHTASLNRTQAVHNLQQIAVQMLGTLALIHSKGMVHADIKPENVLLLTPPGVGLVQVKLIDLGNCFSVSGTDASRVSFEMQTLPFRAPEALLGGACGTGIDIWSLGCVLAEVALKRPLFPVSTAAELMSQITAQLGPIPSKLKTEPQAAPTASHTLTATPDSNPTASATANHLLKATAVPNSATQSQSVKPTALAVKAPTEHFFNAGLEFTDSPVSAVPSRLTPRTGSLQLWHEGASPLHLELAKADACMASLVMSMLQLNPRDRVSAADALRHSFLAGACPALQVPCPAPQLPSSTAQAQLVRIPASGSGHSGKAPQWHNGAVTALEHKGPLQLHQTVSKQPGHESYQPKQATQSLVGIPLLPSRISLFMSPQQDRGSWQRPHATGPYQSKGTWQQPHARVPQQGRGLVHKLHPASQSGVLEGPWRAGLSATAFQPWKPVAQKPPEAQLPLAAPGAGLPATALQLGHMGNSQQHLLGTHCLPEAISASQTAALGERHRAKQPVMTSTKPHQATPKPVQSTHTLSKPILEALKPAVEYSSKAQEPLSSTPRLIEAPTTVQGLLPANQPESHAAVFSNAGAHVAPAAAKATTKDESEHKLAASLESIAQPAALALLAHAAEHVSHAGLVSEPLFQTPAHQRGVPNVNSGGYRTNGQADNRAIVAPKPNMQSPTPATGVLTQGLQDLGTAVKAPSTAEAVAGVASFVGSMTPVTQVKPPPKSLAQALQIAARSQPQASDSTQPQTSPASPHQTLPAQQQQSRNVGLGVNQTPLTNPTTLHTGLRLPKADSHQQQHQSRQQHQPQQQHQQQQLHKSQQQQQHSVQRARIGQYADVMPSTANAGTTNAGSQAGGKQATAQHSDVTAQHGKSLAQHGNSSAQRGEVTADSFLALCVETASKSPSVSPNRRQLHRRRITELPKQAGPVFASAHTKGLESNEKRQGRVCQKQHGGKSGRAGSKSVIREQSERPAVSGACSTGEAVSPSAASQPAAALHVKTHADAAQHDTAQRDTVQCDTAQSDIPQRDTPQRDMAQKATPVHNHRHEQHSMPQKVKAQPAASFSGRTPSHAKLAKQDRPGLPCPRKVLGVQQGRSNASAQQQSPESQHMLDRADDLQSQLAETSQQQSSGIVADSGVLSGSPQGPHAPQQMSSGHGPLHLTQASLLLEPNQASPPSEPKQASPHLVPNQASSQEPPLVGRHLQTRASPVQSKLSTVLPTGLVAMQQSTVAADALQSVRQQPVQQQQPKSKRSKRVGRKRCHSQKGKGRADDAAASSAVANIGRVLEMAPDVRAQDSGSADTESAGPVGVGTAPAVFDKNAKTQKAVVGKRTHREVNVVDTHLEHSSKRHVRSRQGDQKPWWVV